MPVPETTMHENRQPMPRKNEVGTTGQIFPVKPKPVTQPVRDAPHNHFRRRIARPDARHDLAAPSPVDDICHFPALFAPQTNACV